jgi:hypothetical protein
MMTLNDLRTAAPTAIAEMIGTPEHELMMYVDFEEGEDDDAVEVYDKRRDDNSTLMAAHHGRVAEYAIPYAEPRALADWIDNKVLPLVRTIRSGYECRWNGQNHVGCLDDDARAARDALDYLAANGPHPGWTDGGLWDAGDWLQACGPEDIGIDASTTDGELDALVEEIETEAREDHDVILHGDVRGILEQWRDELREEATA